MRVVQDRVVLERFLPVAGRVDRCDECVQQFERVVECGDPSSVHCAQLLREPNPAGLVRHLVKHHDLRIDQARDLDAHLTASRTAEQPCPASRYLVEPKHLLIFYERRQGRMLATTRPSFENLRPVMCSKRRTVA